MDKSKHTDEYRLHHNTSTYSYHWIECMCEQCERLGHGIFLEKGENNDRE